MKKEESLMNSSHVSMGSVYKNDLVKADNYFQSKEENDYEESIQPALY